MSKQYQALSIVAPSAERIVQGSKTLEIRSWQPETLPLKNLVIVENLNFLTKDGDEEMGRAVALVDIEVVRPWQAHEVEILVLLIGLKDIWLGSSAMSVLSPDHLIQ